MLIREDRCRGLYGGDVKIGEHREGDDQVRTLFLP